MAVSLKDVARVAQVAPSTVSIVLNNRTVPIKVSSSTRDRILAVAKEMNYRPNPTARALVTGRNNVIALWMQSLEAPYYLEMMYHVQKCLAEHGYQTIVSKETWNEERPRVASLPVDGAILHGDLRLLPFLSECNPGMPIVAMDTEPADWIDCVSVDRYQPSVLMVRHLCASGRRRIAYLFTRTSDRDRGRAYEQVMLEAGLEPELIPVSDERRSSARQGIKDYVKEQGLPGAIFCNNDDLAIGTCRGLCDLGIRVPDDVALAGCDGIQETEFYNPAVSTITYPVEDMCRLVFDFIARRIQDPSTPRQHACLQAEVVIRDSSDIASRSGRS